MADLLPPELLQQQQELTRQQKMAELLMGQGMQQPQGQMVSGRYVAPSFFAMAAPLAQMYASKSIGEESDKKSRDLAKALRGKYAEELTQYQDLMNGKEVLAPEQAGPAINAQRQAVPMDRQMIRTAPDANAANLFAATAYNPALQAAGTKKLTEGPKWQNAEYVDEKTGKTRQGVINVNSADPISTFQVGGVKPDMTNYERASLNLRAADTRLAQDRFNFDTGNGPVSGGGVGYGGGAPSAPAGPANYQTVNPGSPILARGQQPGMPQPGMQQPGMPQQGGIPPMPRFNSKAEQEVWVADQKNKADLRAKAADALPTALATAEGGIKAIDGLIGDTTVDAKGNLVYGKVAPHPGFKGTVGASGIGSLFGATGFIPGTDNTDFKQRFKQIEGKSFLEAIGSLRGTGQITEIEGAKATAAINRMSLAQSEKEFVTAANELRDVMKKGYASAQQRAGFSPAPMPGNLGGGAPVLRFDPLKNEWLN